MTQELFQKKIAADGHNTRVLSAANEFTSRHSTNVANVWRDSSDPKAQAMLLNCVGGGVNQRQHDMPNFISQTIGAAPDAQPIEHHGIHCRVIDVGRDLEDPEGLLTARYDAQPGTTYLVRPDQHVAARWRSFEPATIRAAIDRATGRN